MREYYSIPSREEADRFSEAYIDAQREYHEHLDEMYENGYEAGKKDATQKWISVKDRLPEDRHSVLVYCPHNKCIYTAYYDDFNDEWYYFGCGGGIEVYYTVTHWMPLPEPPEEVEACKVALMGKSLAEIKEIEGISVERMKDLAKAEAEGRLLVLPCKVGDTVFFAFENEDVFCGKVYEISTCAGTNWFSVRYDGGLRYNHTWDEIGKTVFMTREEAEKALEGMKNDER